MKFFRFLIVYILVQSIFFTSVAHAAGLGGWSITNQAAQGASTVINASKNVVINGANVLKTSTAKITPTASQVGKILGRGLAGYALSVAVEQLLGSVDWVLDPANNQIVYSEPNSKPNEPPKNCQYMYRMQESWAFNGYIYGCSIEEVASKWCPAASNLVKNCSASVRNNRIYLTWTCQTGKTCNGVSATNSDAGTPARVLNPAYNPDYTDEKKTLPLDTVAQQVISNAQGGDASAQAATTAAAADALSNDPATQDNVRQQLDTNAKTNTAEGAEDATGATKPKDPTAPDAGSDFTLKFPVFCGWAPSVCEAAQTVISFPQTLTNWWDRSTKSITDSWTWTKEQYNAVTKSVTDFFKEEPAKDTELDIPEPEMPEIDTELKFGGQCPDDRVAQIPFVLRTIEMKFSYQPVCQVVSDAKPVLIFVGFFIAALIVGGIKQ